MTRMLLPAALLLIAGTAHGLTLPSAFAGSDGAFAPASNTTLNLGDAVTGSWDSTPGTGTGVYDPEQWAVVYRFTSVDIPAGVKVNFQNHPSGAPVIMLVQGNVNILGEISLDGANGHGLNGAASTSVAGPGGFRGGRGARNSTPSSAGYGPGGGPVVQYGGNGSYGTVANARAGVAYGNPGLFPLIGGSGGAGDIAAGGAGGGAGGGAICIATPGIINVAGSIHANGGVSVNCYTGGSGSGGGIRLIANEVKGAGELSAVGGSLCGYNIGGGGRIRIEANTDNLASASSPAYTVGLPGDNPRIFRDVVNGDDVPVIQAVTLGGEAVPADPRPGQTIPPDVQIPQPGVKTLVIEAKNVPQNSVVSVRVVPATGDEEVYQATYTGPGDESGETLWSAQVNLAGGFSTVQAYAALVE